MWTPKRILLLLGGFTLFLLCYVVYAYFFGVVDGTAPLPKEYLPSADADFPPLTPVEAEVDRRLRKAFGEGCKEIEYSTKVEVRSRGLGIATEEFHIDKKRLHFKPFSMAIFGKERGAESFPEINTVRSNEAFLIFDQPIDNLTEIGDRKIVGAELHGEIIIINNRRTSQKSDDIEVRIGNNGSLFYNDAKRKIWSDDLVHLKDTQPQTEPTDIRGRGLDIYLSTDALAARRKAKQKKQKNAQNVGGVERVVLRSNVDMHFHIDAGSQFLGTGPKVELVKQGRRKPSVIPAALKSPKAKDGAPKTSHVIVRTQGPFIYYVEKDLAVFESLAPTAKKADDDLPLFPNDKVEVHRIHYRGEGKLKKEFHDELYCNQLQLQFRKRENSQTGVVQSNQRMDREIEGAHATARKGQLVTVKLDTENLHAYCKELIYKTATANTGAQTILRGNPMWAQKDLHKITAKELRLVAGDQNGDGQHAVATGPGQIDLADPDSKSIDDASRKQKPKRLYHAVWNSRLVVTKDKEGGRTFDLLTFVGQAAFIDDLHDQVLRAEKLQVWLEQAEHYESQTPEARKKHSVVETSRQQPRKLEGFEKVSIESPELNVDKCEYLIVRFKNEPGAQIPDSLPPVAEIDSENADPHVTAKSADGTLDLDRSKGQAAKETVNSPPSRAAPDKKTPNANGSKVPSLFRPGAKKNRPTKPIHLTAKRVAAYVVRTGKKNELQEIFTEGKVHVQQESDKPGEKGVDIKGEALKLYHDKKEGDILIVFGEGKNFAHLQMGDLVLVGSLVTINQRDNTAQVEGMGAMMLPSATTFDGGKNSKPGVRLTIHWNKDMFFNGKDAAFQGGVLALQEKASLRCQTLHVFLDRTVSFKEGQKKGDGAQVERLVCAGKVDIEDTKLDDNKEFVRYDRLLAAQLTMDNQEGPINAGGPGRVDLLQAGSVALQPNQANAKNKKKLHLTRILYQGRLHSNKLKDKTRLARFYDRVEVFHLPAKSAKIKVSPDKLPKGGMYMRCDLLTVYSKPSQSGKATQEMKADGNVFFQTNEFRGRATTVKYYQATERVIFEGSVGNRAVLQRWRKGLPPEELTGTRIIYNRKTGLFSLADGSVIGGGGR